MGKPAHSTIAAGRRQPQSTAWVSPPATEESGWGHRSTASRRGFGVRPRSCRFLIVTIRSISQMTLNDAATSRPLPNAAATRPQSKTSCPRNCICAVLRSSPRVHPANLALCILPPYCGNAMRSTSKVCGSITSRASQPTISSNCLISKRCETSLRSGSSGMDRSHIFTIGFKNRNG